MRLLALRGAITIEANTRDEVMTKTKRLLSEMLDRNGIDHDDIVSILFTATEDITADFPAHGARELGLGDVPLLCARELTVDDGTPLCIRVLVHFHTEQERGELRHVYLDGARGLRDDLPE